jgi:dsDNA-specific endonuclease/ATPase MutS2
MNGPEMIVAIVAICSIAGVLRARLGYWHGDSRRSRRQDERGFVAPQADPDADRMREEIRALKERIAVLERIATDRSTDLDREIEALRERR